MVEFASLGCFYGNFGCRNWGMMQGFGAQLMVAVASSANGFYFIVVKAVAAIAVAVARVVQFWGFDTFSLFFFEVVDSTGMGWVVRKGRQLT